MKSPTEIPAMQAHIELMKVSVHNEIWRELAAAKQKRKERTIWYRLLKLIGLK